MSIMKRGRSLPKQRFLGKNLINRGCNHLKCWADFSVKRKSPFVLRFYFYIPRPNIPTPSLLKEGGKIFQKSSHLGGNTKHFARKGG